MNRIFHPYWKWEDAGMYDVEKEYSEKETENMANLAMNLLSNSERFRKIGLLIIRDWWFACEHNLSNINLNRQAWFGQAACFYEYKIPDRITKFGWRLLSVEQQHRANKVADELIKIWEEKHAENVFKQRCLDSF